MSLGALGTGGSEAHNHTMMDNAANGSQTAIRQLTALVTDPAFLRIQRLGQQANLFRILGRTYTETWHSMLLAWLLDPSGSHGFGDYGLKLFCGAIAGSPSAGRAQDWANLAAFGQFQDAVVSPNERSPHEASFEDGSRPDVNVDYAVVEKDPEAPRQYRLVVEQKILARPSAEQLERYRVLCSKSPSVTFLGALIAPSEVHGIVLDYVEGTPAWSVLGFQALHDQVLVPLQEHPELDDRARLIIGDYVACLRSWKKGIAPVITEKERQLAIDIYERHSAAFKIIAQALRDRVPEADLPESTDEESESDLLLLVDGSEISGNTVREFMTSLMGHLERTGALARGAADGKLPYQTSAKRFLVNDKPQHPDERQYRAAVAVAGWHLEAHASYAQAIRNASKLARRLGCEVVEPE